MPHPTRPPDGLLVVAERHDRLGFAWMPRRALEVTTVTRLRA